MLRNEPTEKSALIKKEKKALSVIIYDNLTYYTPIAGQIGLGAIGLGAGFLYAGPATTCALAPSCGLWLSNLTSEKVAIGVFFAGGLDYAGINAYFSSESVKNYFTFVSKQPSWLAKISWGSAIIVYTASQGVSSFLSSKSTSSKTWQTIITVAGSTPGNLYTAVGTAQYEIPMLRAYLLRKFQFVQESLFNLCLTPSTEETFARMQRDFYIKQHAEFLKSVDSHWTYIKSYPREFTAHEGDTPLSYLFSSHTAEPNAGFLRYTAKKTGQTIALGMSAAISVPMIINNFDTVHDYVPHAAAGLLTTYFSYSFIYSNVKLCMNFVDGVLKLLDHIVSGRPIDSLVFQLHPYITMGALALVLATSAMSFALMNTIYEMVFPDKNPTREAFRCIADVSMILYHFAGLYHLYELLLSKLTWNKQDKFLFQVEAEVELLHKMTTDEYKKFVLTNSDIDNERYGIQAFQDAPASINHVERGISRHSATLFGSSETLPVTAAVISENQEAAASELKI